MQDLTESDIKELNALLRGELSAVETYQQCIEKMDEPGIIPQLEILQESHRARSIMIKERIHFLGGEPQQDSGVWGSFAKAAESAASIFGQAAAVSMLEEGEHYGLNEYKEAVANLSHTERSFVEQTIYPEQQKSYVILKALDVPAD